MDQHGVPRNVLPQKTKLNWDPALNSICPHHEKTQEQGEKPAHSSCSEQIVCLIPSTHIALCPQREIPLCSTTMSFLAASFSFDICQMRQILSVAESLRRGPSL